MENAKNSHYPSSADSEKFALSSSSADRVKRLRSVYARTFGNSEQFALSFPRRLSEKSALCLYMEGWKE